MNRLLFGVRYMLPAALVVAGFVVLFAAGDTNRWDGWAMLVGAGLAVLLLDLALGQLAGPGGARILALRQDLQMLPPGGMVGSAS